MAPGPEVLGRTLQHALQRPARRAEVLPEQQQRADLGPGFEVGGVRGDGPLEVREGAIAIAAGRTQSTEPAQGLARVRRELEQAGPCPTRRLGRTVNPFELR